MRISDRLRIGVVAAPWRGATQPTYFPPVNGYRFGLASILGGLPFGVPPVRQTPHTTDRISGCSVSVIVQVPCDLADRQRSLRQR
jgi:hypothetical protein